MVQVSIVAEGGISVISAVNVYRKQIRVIITSERNALPHCLLIYRHGLEMKSSKRFQNLGSDEILSVIQYPLIRHIDCCNYLSFILFSYTKLLEKKLLYTGRHTLNTQFNLQSS